MAASTPTTAEFSAAIDRMRQRIGTARSSRTMRARPRAARLAGRSAASSCRGVAKTNSLHLAADKSVRREAIKDFVADQRHIVAIEIDGAGAAHVAQRLYGRIVLAPGIGGAKFTRDRAHRDRRQKQRNDECYGPRKVGAAVHRQLSPYDDVGGGKKRFNAFLAEAGERWLF